MKKIISLIAILVFILSFSSVYAVDIDMDLEAIVDENISETDSNVISEGNEQTPSQKISTTSTTEDYSLSVSDIINIILISVGIVIILLAIAILIKIR